jgi:hypothetical protein
MLLVIGERDHVVEQAARRIDTTVVHRDSAVQVLKVGMN